MSDDPLLIPVWIIHGSKRHQRRAGVLLAWERRSTSWWALVAETRVVDGHRERRVSWYAGAQLREIGS